MPVVSVPLLPEDPDVALELQAVYERAYCYPKEGVYHPYLPCPGETICRAFASFVGTC